MSSVLALGAISLGVASSMLYRNESVWFHIMNYTAPLSKFQLGEHWLRSNTFTTITHLTQMRSSGCGITFCSKWRKLKTTRKHCATPQWVMYCVLDGVWFWLVHFEILLPAGNNLVLQLKGPQTFERRNEHWKTTVVKIWAALLSLRVFSPYGTFSQSRKQYGAAFRSLIVSVKAVWCTWLYCMFLKTVRQRKSSNWFSTALFYSLVRVCWDAPFWSEWKDV